jgi:hypothetical protein
VIIAAIIAAIAPTVLKIPPINATVMAESPLGDPLGAGVATPVAVAVGTAVGVIGDARVTWEVLGKIRIKASGKKHIIHTIALPKKASLFKI